MEATNWVFRALLLSLCLGLCYGYRAGPIGQHTTMSTSIDHEVGVDAGIGEDKHDSRPQPPRLLPIGVDGVYCSTDDCSDDHIIVPDPRQFIVGCEQLSGYSQCQWRMNDVDTISEYIRGIQAKLDETCWRSIASNIDSMNKDAMPPN